MSWMLFLATEAFAAPPSEVTVVARGVGETMDDANLGSVYRYGVFLAGLGVVVPVHPRVALDLEVASGRVARECDSCENPAKFMMRPISLLVEGTLPLSAGVGFAGVGIGLATFHETAEDWTGSGGIGSLELRAGLRVDTNLEFERSRAQLEIYGGRRMQRHTEGEGFDLAAWRGSIGVGFVF